MLLLEESVFLQGELDQLFAVLDRSMHPVETGTISKGDITTALESYFKVGEPGGKSRERFDALLQAMDADQKGQMVSYKSLFEEDREFNQGTLLRTCLIRASKQGSSCSLFDRNTSRHHVRQLCGERKAEPRLQADSLTIQRLQAYIKSLE